MSSTSKRIVLLDPLGDILFSGESMIAREAAKDESDTEICPETMRSAGSGVYRAAERYAVTAVTEHAAADYDTEPRTQKQGGRAA